MERQEDSPYTDTFARLPRKKRDHILAVAKRVFARDGFAAASINEVAREAGVSVGGLYRYFSTKDHLLLTLIERGVATLEETFDKILDGSGTPLDRIEAVINAAIEHATADPEMVQVYVDCTTQGMGPLMRNVSRTVENLSAAAYQALVREGQAGGEIDPDLDPEVTAFCLDNLFLMIQFAWGGAYYRERAELYLGEDLPDARDRVTRGVMAFIRNALAPARLAEQPGPLPILPRGKTQTDEPTAWGGGVAGYGDGLEVDANPDQEVVR